MACFLVPLGLVIITTLLSRRFLKKYRINWLNALLWGGIITLAVEHVAHGEIVPYPPFLTAGLPEILPEMLTVGVPMTATVCLLWGAMTTIDLKLLGRVIRPTAGMRTQMGAIRK